MEFKFGDALRSQISQNLEQFDRIALDTGDLRLAAVAIVVVKSDVNDEACFLLTLRPVRMNRHSNQYALPGGRLDEGETTQQAALRELHEEVGVELGSDQVIGVLDDYATRSGFRITPIVVWGGDCETLAPDPGEVEAAFRIPLSDINADHVPRLIPSDEGEHPVLCAHIETLGHTVYAPTAAIFYQFREVALRGNPTRVAHFDQPAFAWK
ncbi:MAG: CoA pyrophosphatase [Rhizobiales bacterium]|nr:CoA pyrophosphatase [Hyphomicrobiales bacterium]